MKNEYYVAKWYVVIGVVIVAYALGFILGFASCSTIPKANAAQIPNITNVQNTQSNVYTQTMYVNGQYYIVFTSSASSMAVVKK